MDNQAKHKTSFGKQLLALIKSFTPYQITYLVVVLAVTAAFVIFMPDMMLDDTSNKFVLVCSVIAVIANPICELLISKQSKMNFLVDIFLIEATEFFVCLHIGSYAVAAVTLLFWIPVDIVSYAQWSKKPDEIKEEETQVRRLTWAQDVGVIAAVLAFGFGVGYLMSKLPGLADGYLDAFSAAFGMANGILLLLRYNEQWYAWFATLVCYTALYIQTHSYIMLVTVAAMFVNTCYGFVKWLIYTKNHKKLHAAARSKREKNKAEKAKSRKKTAKKQRQYQRNRK